MKITWFTHTSVWTLKLVYKLSPVSQIAKDLSFIIHIEGKLLPSSKVSQLDKKNNKITDACSLTNILAIVKAHSDNISKSLFDIKSIIDSVAKAIEEDSTIDKATTGKMLVLIEQFMVLLRQKYIKKGIF